MDSEVIVVGSGFSGTAAAYVLASMGVSVIAIDRNDVFPNVFRAEKLEPKQAEALDGFGLLDFRQPKAGPMGKTVNYKDGVKSDFDTVNQYGICYSDTVNSFRRALEQKADIVYSKVTDVKITDTVQTVVTDDREYSCRLIIIATGGNDLLLNKVGIARRKHSTLTSLSFAFDMALEHGESFPFNGFNYFLTSSPDNIDYITIFKIGDVMRANVFTQWSVKSPNVKNFKASPVEMLDKYFPQLRNQIGSYKIVSVVKSFPTGFYRLAHTDKPGIVVIGDDFQSVSPATGSGLDKIITDVDRLCNVYIPDWLETPGMNAAKIKRYYSDEIKRAEDDASLESWISYRDAHRNFWGQQLSRLEIHCKRIFNLW